MKTPTTRKCKIEGCNVMNNSALNLCPLHRSEVYSKREGCDETETEGNNSANLPTNRILTRRRSNSILENTKALVDPSCSEESEECQCHSIAEEGNEFKYDLYFEENDLVLQTPSQCLFDYGLDERHSANLNLTIVAKNSDRPSKLQVVFIQDHMKTDLFDKKFISYSIKVRYGDLVWSVEHRYNQFAKLHRKLQKLFPKLPLPKLPPKKVIGSRTPSFIVKRRSQIFEYMKQSLLIEDVAASLPMMEFLGMLSSVAMELENECK